VAAEEVTAAVAAVCRAAAMVAAATAAVEEEVEAVVRVVPVVASAEEAVLAAWEAVVVPVAPEESCRSSSRATGWHPAERTLTQRRREPSVDWASRGRGEAGAAQHQHWYAWECPASSPRKHGRHASRAPAAES